MKWKDSFHPYAAVTILFWSLAYILTRLLLQYFSAFSLGFLRYLIASAALIPVALFTKMKLPCKKDVPWFLASGAVGFFLYVLVFNQGQVTVTASTSSVVIATVPVITALLARFAYQEKLRGYQWAAIVLEFAGVVVLTLMNGVFSINIGLIWLLIASVTLSVYNLLQRRLTKTYTPLQASTYSIFVGTALLTVFLPVSVEEAVQAPAVSALWLLLLGVCSSAVAYVAWATAFSKAKQTSQVSNYMFVTPFLTSLLGLMIGEVPDRATLLGGGIILTGVLVFNFGGKLSGLVPVKSAAKSMVSNHRVSIARKKKDC